MHIVSPQTTNDAHHAPHEPWHSSDLRPSSGAGVVGRGAADACAMQGKAGGSESARGMETQTNDMIPVAALRLDTVSWS